MAVSARRCHFSLTSFSVSLLCNLVLSALSLQSRYVHFTRVRKFHDSLTLNYFFSITSQTFVTAVLYDSLRSSCPLLFLSFALHQWVGILWYCLRQLLWKLASHAKKSKPRILRKSFSSLLFLQFQALTFKHCSSFSCPNTFLFDLPSSFFITEDTVTFQNHFLKNYGRMPRSSRLLNCFWILCGRFQAINIFGKALLTVSMLAMIWFQFLRHLVELIFHSIWWVGRFHRSPLADILKLFQSILSLWQLEKYTNDLPAECWKWTTHQGFLLCFWSSSLCMLCPSRRHVFR